MGLEEANRKRDARLRRAMLEALHNARGYLLGGLSGQFLLDVAAAGLPEDQGFEDGEHLIRLSRDLKAKGLVTEDIDGVRRGQRLQPSHLFLRITAMGSDLLDESIPPINGIDDERVRV